MCRKLVFRLVDAVTDRVLADLDFGIVRNADDETVVLYIRYGAENAAAGHDVVTGLQLGDHLLVLLLTLALRRNDQEPHTGEKQDDW